MKLVCQCIPTRSCARVLEISASWIIRLTYCFYQRNRDLWSNFMKKRKWKYFSYREGWEEFCCDFLFRHNLGFFRVYVCNAEYARCTARFIIIRSQWCGIGFYQKFMFKQVFSPKMCNTQMAVLLLLRIMDYFEYSTSIFYLYLFSFLLHLWFAHLF